MSKYTVRPQYQNYILTITVAEKRLYRLSQRLSVKAVTTDTVSLFRLT